jgi:hypothetical protein
VVVLAALAAVTVLGMLRVLAATRAHAVESHDALREIRRLRNEYYQKSMERKARNG